MGSSDVPTDVPTDLPGDAPAFVRAGACGRRTLLGCGVAAACAPALAQLAGCAPRVDDPIAVELDTSLVNKTFTVLLSRVPELAQPGGSIIVRPQATDALGRRISILLINERTQGVLAFDAYCPHAGCEVAWVDKDAEVICPCHLSRFDVGGRVLHPPALTGLQLYPVKPSKILPSTVSLSIDLNVDEIFPAAVDGAVTFALSDIPALEQVGGSVTGNAKSGVSFPLLVMRVSATQLLAFDATCPHLGCAVNGNKTFAICPCHGSIFGLDGSVKNGPATGPLRVLPVTFDGTTAGVKVA